MPPRKNKPDLAQIQKDLREIKAWKRRRQEIERGLMAFWGGVCTTATVVAYVVANQWHNIGPFLLRLFVRSMRDDQ